MCQGASDGMKLTLNVLAMLIGFTAAIAAINFLLVQPQQWANVQDPITIDRLLGWMNAPFAFPNWSALAGLCGGRPSIRQTHRLY